MKVSFNGEFLPADAPLLTAQNRSFKWGDGLFETIKVFNGSIVLWPYHLERLSISLQLLGIVHDGTLADTVLSTQILHLCRENGCLQSARVRVAVYRNDDNRAGYVIEAFALDASVNDWQIEGLTLCLYPHARKGMDAFANIKSAAHLPYVLAGRFAAENGFGDALVLNATNRLCDSSKANLFLVQGNTITTPALHQGCINGVMRRVVMEEVKKLGYRLRHDEVSEEELLKAEEVFLTNAIQIIRWVKSYKTATYNFQKTERIFRAVSAAVFSPSILGE